jgi:hypothetical protein
VFAPHAAALRKLKHQVRHSFENGAEVEAKLACCSAQKLKERDNAVSAKLIKEYLMLVRPLSYLQSAMCTSGHLHSAVYLCLGRVKQACWSSQCRMCRALVVRARIHTSCMLIYCLMHLCNAFIA